MFHFHSLQDVDYANAWATIGMFDGVHRGHQAILTPLIQEAHATGHPAIVITFFPHPIVVLRGATDPVYLTTPDERAALLGELGVDAVITLPFDRALASMSAPDFIRELKQHLGLHQLWVGFDFALGRDRQGDIPTLRRLGEEMGYGVRVTPEVSIDGTRVSSSQIRKLIKEGRVAQATRLLGRPYAMTGPVIHGDGRGRGLGIPTANVGFPPQKIVPMNGIYATWSKIDGQRFPSVTNVGIRPMFNGDETRVEAHILQFDRDIYDREIQVEFIEFLRPEERFPSVEDMLVQIEIDKQQAQEVLQHAA